MTYRILPTHLHIYAEAVKKYFKTHKGITSFKTEEPIVRDGIFRHTLTAETKDGHYICVEVSESAYIDTLDAVVLDYRNKILPVKLYVAIPKTATNTNLQKQLSQARKNGVGVLEVDEKTGDIIHEALSQSLAGLRPIDLQAFPPKYRAPLSDAANTFHNGNPAKGCSMIYDEIEALTRRIASKTQKKGCWKTIPKLKIDKDPWANVLEAMMDQLNASACSCPELKKIFLAKILGITSLRNETGHKIQRRADLVKRDKRLRTRFEEATDLLLDLINASKPLHV
ncbi:MAG TPA: hypothetical protein VF290_02350 [Pyrinomonadaceae bacterium]